MSDSNNWQERLAEPFEASEIAWKPQVMSKDKTSCMAIAYIDARNVMERLDAVIGIGAWKDEYTQLPGGSVQCRLYVRIGDEWVYREDVGSPSDQPDAGDKLKAAFSDAFKRAAVKYGIGRYLYSLEGCWVPYDATKRKITNEPKLPTWALPRPNLTPTELENLKRLIVETASAEPKIYELYRIKALPELTRGAYQRLVCQLLTKAIGKAKA